MFMGQYSHSLDEKGRLTVPSKFRESLGLQFVVTKGLDGCLYAYPMEEWKKIETKFSETPLTSKDARKFSRFFFASACEMEIDKQGRVLIPQNLRDYAGLLKDVTLAGMLNRIEIWDSKRFEEGSSYDEDEMDDIAEHMADLGLGI